MDRKFFEQFESLAKEDIDKIMAEHGKAIQREQAKMESIKQELGTAKQTVSDMTAELQGLKDSGAAAEDWKQKFEQLQDKVKQREEADKAAKADAELTQAIVSVFGDKKFTSEYVKKGLIEDMKAEIAKPENKGKGYAELFESLTKDKDGIFANPNPPADMTGMGNVESGTLSENAMRAVMGLPVAKE